MRELQISDLELTAGGVRWDQFAAGAASVAVGVAIAATPVGWVGAAFAGAASYFGGVVIGDALVEGSIFDGSNYNQDGSSYNGK